MSNAQFVRSDGQVDIRYAMPANDAADLGLTVSVFADRGLVRDGLSEDAAKLGFRLGLVGRLADLLEGPARALGDVVLIECPVVDVASVAALARLDQRATNTGAELVVSTSVDALDDVFAALEQCNPQILVMPSRAERIVALGQVLGRLPQQRVRELSEDDRLLLLRLTEQVAQIGERIDRLGSGAVAAPVTPAPAASASAFRFDADGHARSGEDRLVRKGPASLPDPRLVRRIIRQRQMRARYFDGDLFADPAWDMLLDLTAASAEQARVSVTSLCIASGVPPTTALRWIGQMTDAGLLRRIEDENDRRRAFITLTDKAIDAMSRYFADIGEVPVKQG
ncbi:MAG: winged helix DNA-binding protein [Sphingomonadales bacterium]|nr:winged helix DNA-binding protein [Sphingomonadales bacterium]MDE2169683.1 winged helix DNA-binding protein [Sphingomonadales bacterium]